MDEATVDPKVIWGVAIFVSVMLAAGIGRWLLNVREDIEDAKEARAKTQTK